MKLSGGEIMMTITMEKTETLYTFFLEWLYKNSVFIIDATVLQIFSGLVKLNIEIKTSIVLKEGNIRKKCLYFICGIYVQWG